VGQHSSKTTLRSFDFANRVARFFLAQHTKTGKNIPNDHKNPKCPQNRPNGHKICQHIPLQDPTKFSQI
jgi:hypothetical protein